MDKLENYGICAVSLYFSGICNLQCRYCFQPKIGSIMTEENEKIRDWISSGKMEDDLDSIVGKSLTDLAFWGGEPSINLPYIIPKMESLMDRFPKLKKFFYSTNLSTKKLAENTMDFIKFILNYNDTHESRKIFLELQISIDGIPEINDHNRIGSKAETIMENLTWILGNLQGIDNLDRSLSIHFKGTQSQETFNWLCTDNNLYRHYKYFDDWYSKWDDLGYRWYPTGAEFITFVYPGNFTQEDGKNLCDLTKKIYSKEFQSQFSHEMSKEHQISGRIRNLYETLKRGYFKEFKHEFICNSSCSAGRSCVGLSYDGSVHLCHSDFMFTDSVMKYIENNNLITEFETTHGFTFRNYSKIRDLMSWDMNDNLKFLRGLGITKNYVEGLNTREQYLQIILSEMAIAGQISPVFKEEKWRNFAISYFLVGGANCPANNIQEFNSVWVSNNSHYKLILNGTMEYVLETMREEGKV